MINPYVIIAVIGIWIASLTGTFFWRGNEVEQVTNAKWTQRELEQVAAANKLLKDTEEAYRIKESAWASAQADIVTKYTKEAQNEKSKNDIVIAGLRSGRQWLSFNQPAQAGSACGTDLPSSPTSLPGSNATQIIELPREIGANLYALASDADAFTDQLRTCQALIVADRAK